MRRYWWTTAVPALMALACVACGMAGGGSAGGYRPQAPDNPGSLEALVGTTWVVQGMPLEFRPDGELAYGLGGAQKGTYSLNRGILTLTLADGNTFKGEWSGEAMVVNGSLAERVG